MILTIFCIILFLFLVIVGIPIAIALGTSGIILIYFEHLGIKLVGPNFVHSIAKFPLLAIPFFVLAGVILEKARLAERIATLFELIVGKTSGGLAIVAIVTCMFWGALSGSGPATAAAVGIILLGPMIKHGYDKNFAAATIANASDISIIIPPSIAFIIYGNITKTNVSKLFIAGILPGILSGLGIVFVAWYISQKRGYRGIRKRGSAKEIFFALKNSFWALLAPVIILGGIYSGIFTPTEAAVVAVFYGLFVSMVIYRSVSLRDIIPIFTDAAVTTSAIMFIVVFAGVFSSAMETTGVIDAMTKFVISVSPNALVIILLINALLLFLGMFLDAISISYLLMPALMPVMLKYNINPVWYGVIFITALAIGQSTPPVGVNLFTIANIVKSDVDSISKEIIPYIIINIIVLALLSVFSSISLLLPSLM